MEINQINYNDGDLAKSENHFQRARTTEQIIARKTSILETAKALYAEEGLNAISFRNIAERLGWSRQAIYKYYNTKEEIFLELMYIDKNAWSREVLSLVYLGCKLSKSQYAAALAEIYYRHPLGLELGCIYRSVIAENCDEEKLYKAMSSSKTDTYHLLYESVSTNFPDSSEEARKNFAAIIDAYMAGIYMYNRPSKLLDKHESVTGYDRYPDLKYNPNRYKELSARGILCLLDTL